jgi:hypothetical protein
VRITRVSMLTGHEATLDVPCTPYQLRCWQEGTLLQEAMPQVPPPLREFVKSGITPEEWTETFGQGPVAP